MFSSKNRGLKTSLLAVPLAACLQVVQAQAQAPDQRTFASAEEASHALFVAVEADETGAIAQILGQGDQLTSSSDPEQDKLDRTQFVRKYREMHRLARERDGEVVLYIGAENWPFPIPLTSHNGQWRYDADTGQQEVLYRRIGENEVTAIETCHALVATLKKPQAHAVAATNPTASLLNSAPADGKPVPFRGYTFRILSNGRAPVIVAYPTLYGSSGVMTFIVSGTGVVYQKDLGSSTEAVATTMTAPHHDSTWTRAETGLEDPH
jgi:Protein of unknown function (DUF2950)